MLYAVNSNSEANSNAREIGVAGVNENLATAIRTIDSVSSIFSLRLSSHRHEANRHDRLLVELAIVLPQEH